MTNLVRCFELFYGRFGDQEILLAMNFDSRIKYFATNIH